MDTTPEPFLLLEPDAAPRLEAVPPIMPAAEPLSRGWSPAFIGVATLGLGIPTLWGAWLVGALFDRRSALGWAGSVVLLVGLSLIGLGIGRELRGLAALRRSIGSAMSLPVERRIGFSGRRGVGWNGYRSTLRSCQLSPQLTPRICACALAFGAGANATGRDGRARADRRSSKRRDRCSDPFTRIGRSGRGLVRCAADTTGRSAAWNAARNARDAGIATENRIGCGDGCRGGDRRERRHSCDGIASAVATFGG